MYKQVCLFRVFLILFCLLWGGLVFWQILRVDVKTHPANPRAYQVYLTRRGSILDRSGQSLVISEASEQGYERRYLDPISASHITGYLNSRYGLSGLERSYHLQLNRQQELVVTIDKAIQQVAESLLLQPGAIVVMQPKTGAILALVSRPFLDPNQLARFWQSYQEDPFKPFLNRTTSGLYPPGSVIKPFVLAAAYEEHIASPHSSFHDRGAIVIGARSIRNFGQVAHGEITAAEALAVSSNAVYAELAMHLQVQTLTYYQQFGLDTRWDLGIVSTRSALPSSDQSAYGWGQLGIGQGDLLVTPLQMAVAVSTIANRGVRMEPYLVQEIKHPWLFNRIHRPRAHATVVSSLTAAHVRDAMVTTVNQGTATAAQIPGIEVAGKTGTAQNSQGADHAWFIGFAPAHDAEVAVVVLLEHGGSGGLRAAPIARDVITAALERVEERLIP